MAATIIFDEDEVCIPTSSGGFKYGLVIESSEYVSSDDDEDDDIEDRVQKGKIKVAWHPSGKETVIAEEKVILTDRSLMPGDVVRRLVSGKESQRGFVQECHIKCHVKVLGTEHYIYNVDAQDLKPLQEFDPEPEVTMDSWVGHVLGVTEEMTVKFPCGARCKLKGVDQSQLEDVNEKRRDYSEFNIRNYYVGQELSGTFDDYEDAEWLFTSNVRGPKCKVKHLMKAPVLVEDVKTHSVDVTWTCKGFTQSGAGTDQLKSPPEVIEGEDLRRLKRLDCFEYCHMQIGDKAYYTVKESDTILHKMSPRQHVTPDIVELTAKENVIVLGTRSDGLVIKQRGVEKRSADKPLQELTTSQENENDTKNCDTLKEKQSKQGRINDIGMVENRENVKENDDGGSADDEYEDIEDDVSDREAESDDNSSSCSGHDGQDSHNSPTPRRKRRHTGVMPHSFKKREVGKGGKKRRSKRAEREVKPGDRVPVEIWYTFSCCDVMWQDGHVEEKVPSPELFPIHHLDELEFFPGDFVQDGKAATGTEYGVIVSSDYKERTVMVKWIKPYTPGQADKPDENEAVELSVFDIKDHPDYNFRCGSTVLRVGGFEEGQEYEAVGQVYTLDPEGTVQVWWPTGTITKCFPQDLFLPGEEYHSESETEDEEEEEEEEEECGSDVSWETEGEESASDMEMEPRKNKPKTVWTVNDSKRKELDILLDRAQTALTGLLKIFVNVSGPYFKNSREIFKDILSIFKRCKQVEKILKSSFFDDDEIADLIGDIKAEILKEKARHVADVYKFRTGACSGIPPRVKDGDDSVHDDDVKTEGGTQNLNHKVDGDLEKGAVGGMSEATVEKKTGEWATLENALKDVGTRINPDDPMVKIILDNYRYFLKSTSQNSAQPNVLNGDTEGGAGDITVTTNIIPGQQENGATVFHGSGVGNTKLTGSEIMQTLIKSLCDDGKLTTQLEDIKQKAGLIQNSPVEDAQNCDKSENVDSAKAKVIKETSADRSGPGEEGVMENDSQQESRNGTQSGSGIHIGTLPFSEKTDDAVMAPNHRTLCIRVCKALNARLMHIKQEVSRKWLTFKFGCDENVSDAELFEKLQEKMIESVESGNGPLSLGMQDEPLPILKQSDVTEATGECLKELESLEKLRNSFEAISPGGKENCPMENGVPEATEDDMKIEVIEEGDKETVEQDTDRSFDNGEFSMCSEVPFCHRYKYEEGKATNQKAFLTAMRKEWTLLRTSLPKGIFVKAFEDRMDLVSVLIKGPECTPYEGGLFAFDVHLPPEFPFMPPVFHYWSYCSDRLNPNLYEDGKVCVSLLGTWTGKGSECWTVGSSLLQVLVSIQGLILVKEPYYNEAGYEKQRGSQHGMENSRMYNEMAILKLIQSMTKMAVSPPGIFVEETKQHLKTTAQRLIDRVEYWIECSNKSRSDPITNSKTSQTLCNGDIPHPEHSASSSEQIPSTDASSNEQIPSTDSMNNNEQIPSEETCKKIKAEPEFSLLPASKGFCITVKKHLDSFKEVLAKNIFTPDLKPTD